MFFNEKHMKIFYVPLNFVICTYLEQNTLKLLEGI